MDKEASDFVDNKQWGPALEIYTKLLHSPGLDKQQFLFYIYMRMGCLSELGQHEGVINDSRAILELLGVGEENERIEFKVRQRLVYSLLSLQRHQEAELIVQEWTSKNKARESSKCLSQLCSNFYNQSHNLSRSSMNGFVQENLNRPRCIYCNSTFNDQIELRLHCQSEAHQMAVMSDEGRDWHFRPPPRGYNGDHYVLCESFLENNNCRYGVHCTEAHGAGELNEWKERFQYRLMKMQRAYEKELYGKSYTEELLEQWLQSSNPEEIMKENLDYVICSCLSDLTISIPTKNTCHSWKFAIQSAFKLKSVALLQDTYRNHFEIASIIYKDLINNQFVELVADNKQEWTTLINENHQNQVLSNQEYNITINFHTNIFGTFRQSIVFNFGSHPVLVKHVCVDVVPIMDLEKINDIKKEIILSNGNRWNSSNCNIIPFNSVLTTTDPWIKTLQAMYPNPNPETFVLSQSTIIEKHLSRHNYKTRMHELLFLEELARNEQISMYNLKTKLTIAQSYVLTYSNSSSTAKYSNNGELFALIKLGTDLSEDTPHGRLILSNCTSVLLAPDGDEFNNLTVYECLIEDKGKNVIYLRISAKAVLDLNLNINYLFPAQIQFQLNRIPYCEWHYAVDKLNDFKLIYPDVFVQPEIPWSPGLQWNEGMDTRLNVKQREAIIAISTPLYVKLPPILIIGPFGTGKTFTLAQAIKHLLSTPFNRILICTHSNSAADLYIKDYLDPYVKSGHPEATPLRIYYQKRWVATVHDTVQKYCLIDGDGSNSSKKNFRLPTIDEIKNHRIIVVTLSISMYLTTIGLPKGFFTHILLDEAAQAIECESIMPLALANENTRIVLAGDHMQLSPEVYSKIAKERKFHVSLLERLYDHYPTNFPCKILLSENYRAHKAIIDFTSESFYDQRLVACGKQPSHENYYPLTFYTTRGEDVQDQNSTAFYNNSEVYELVERVTELRNVWPENWGKFNEHSIGIMSPYSDQVFRIRTELRKRKMHGISVERVLNVQGKQFRAVFLSTVRTRRTCQQKNNDELEYGFLSNSKLLNTAVTRAQSLVVVVGDPVSLCTIGRCSKVWERFLEICEKNHSLFGISWSQLRNQLDGVELKKNYGLNPLAPEFVPRKHLMEAYIINSKVSPNFVWPANVEMIKTPASPTISSSTQPPPQQSQPRPVFYQIPPPTHFNTLPQFIHVPRIPPLIPRPTYIINSNYFPKYNPPPPFIQNTNLFPPILPPQQQPPINKIIPTNENIQIIQSKQPLINMNQEEKGMIQFLGNVHFPESMQNSTLNECVNLLPPNMTLADMITQNYKVQESWFRYLLNTKGIEAAKKFECLIHLTTKRDRLSLTPTNSNVNGVCHNIGEHNLSGQDNWTRINMNDSVFLMENGTQPKSTPLYQRGVSNSSPSNKLDEKFSNLSLGETTASLENKSYASVLKKSKPVTPLELINNLKPDNSENDSRLYQYFV
ncbi:probable helicase with zinc finger domain [Onthophagus taurus]|uniref:probable helicase with zinc finger domain n=1 Tax=Onthophagus taurus TaxID=166361 RepID=UPI000C1FFDE9|nr:probable helicase with zinc finger domain [Onthophagus taurus]